MGSSGFASDVWRFDAAAEVWSEIPVTSSVVPAGRRFPWTAVAPDESILLYGYGSDSPMGDSVLRDLWAFELATGSWSRLAVDGERPVARAFTSNWAGPPGSVGVLAFGVDANLTVFEDTFVVWPPDTLAGRWH